MRLYMANSYTSLKTVADKVLRHPMMAGISFEAIIDYTVDFMRIVKCPTFFEDKCVDIEIKKYIAELPDDFFEMNQVRLITNDCRYQNNNMFVYASNNFHQTTPTGLTYKIQGNCIFTSIEEGVIEISYQAFMIDDEGYPMIPDNSKFTRALEAYIKKQWFTILFDMGKLQSGILQNAQQEYAWAVGAVESEFQHFTIDKAESFYNSWRNMLINTRKHYRGFSTNS